MIIVVMKVEQGLNYTVLISDSLHTMQQPGNASSSQCQQGYCFDQGCPFDHSAFVNTPTPYRPMTTQSLPVISSFPIAKGVSIKTEKPSPSSVGECSFYYFFTLFHGPTRHH